MNDEINEVKIMAKNEVKKVESKKNHYHNPTEKWWGKLVVWIILFGMVGGIIFGFILAIINGQG